MFQFWQDSCCCCQPPATCPGYKDLRRVNQSFSARQDWAYPAGWFEPHQRIKRIWPGSTQPRRFVTNRNIFSLQILLSPGRSGRRRTRSLQSPDPRDDGPQRDHRLCHRERRIQDCGNKVRRDVRFFYIDCTALRSCEISIRANIVKLSI